jgi:hypothetical protein
MNGQRPVAHVAYRIDHQGQAGNVIHVAMREKHMVDLCQFGDRQVSHSRAAIDQNVAVDQYRSGAQVTATDASAATQNAYFHLFCLKGRNPIPTSARRLLTIAIDPLGVQII